MIPSLYKKNEVSHQTKSAISCAFGRIYWRRHFLCSTLSRNQLIFSRKKLASLLKKEEILILKMWSLENLPSPFTFFLWLILEFSAFSFSALDRDSTRFFSSVTLSSSKQHNGCNRVKSNFFYYDLLTIT